jgi:hypothetical protein
MIRVGRIFRACLSFRPSLWAGKSHAPAASRRNAARRAALWGLFAFGVVTAALAVSLETVKPEWRDPEYGHRIRQLRKWKAEAPARPLVVVFGSSRTQMGISPAAMGFPDEPGSPVVYNFGYRAGRLFRSWFQLMRVLDSGPKPDYILVQLSMVDLLNGIDGDLLSPEWGGRLGASDFHRLAPYLSDLAPFRRTWAGARLTGWSAHRGSIVSDVMPGLQPAGRRVDYYWERLDRYGFVPHHIEVLMPSARKAMYDWSHEMHSPAFSRESFAAISDRAIRDLVARCRAERIPVAFFWAPESATYRSWYTDGARAAMDAYQRRLVAEFGVAVFPAPEDLPDTDFVDGYHLMRHGAEKYSRWLADTHLKPWLLRHSSLSSGRER